MTDKSRKKTDGKEDAAEASKMQEDLCKAREEAEKYLDMARRLQADFDNYRKRTQKENEDFRKYASEGIVKELLPIIDDLDRALANVREDTDLSVGIRGVRKNMMKVLEEKGVKDIPAEGRFNPELHEALCTVEGDKDGDIAEVLQKGYQMNGRVLRYAKVRVTVKKEDNEKVS